MKHHLVVYSSDLHGNETQYQKLVEYALQISAQSIIIGGDIAPKHFSTAKFIDGQRKFLKEHLPELLAPLHKKSSSIKVFLMLGNDDAAANQDVLEEQHHNRYIPIHGKRIPLTKEYDLVGYSYVPITPFGIKDWEKFDLSTIPAHLHEQYDERKRTNYRWNGFKTSAAGWHDFMFTPEMEKTDSIQRDLATPLFTQKAQRTLYIIHTPPDQTHLDQIINGSHVGSLAVRDFIEKWQPYLTLHGHIHETVDVSGYFREDIGRTICLSSGNHNVGETVAIIKFDLSAPEKAERILL